MIVRTDAATTDDWLRANKEITIAAHVQNYTPTAAVLESPILPIPDKGALDVLTKISVSLPLERHPVSAAQIGLDLEFQAWDSLSDEAFLNLEQNLG